MEQTPMAELDLDWDALEKESGKGGALPVGEYTCDISTAEAAATKNGKPMIKLIWLVAVGPKQGSKIFHNLTVSADSPTALAIFFRQLQAIGVGRPAQGVSLAQVAASMVGRRAVLVTDQREWPEGSGQMRTEVKSVKAAIGTVPGGTPAGVPGPPQPGQVTAVAAAPPAPPAPTAAPAAPATPTTPAAPASPPRAF
jgi:Protein of unknown function (DUF669)